MSATSSFAKSKLLASRDLDMRNDLNEPETKAEKRTVRTWIWIFILFLLLFLVGSIVIVIIAIEEGGQTLPEKIDVVLFIRPGSSTPLTLRAARYKTQARAVQKYMPWVNKIWVLSPTHASGEDADLGVTYVNVNKDTVAGAFEYMPSITDIAEYAIFLSDQTYPFRPVKKSFLFFDSRPRMFNIFREQSEVNLLQEYLEDTMPTLVTEIKKLNKDPKTWQKLVFREITSNRVVLRNDMNRDILMDGGMTDNLEDQFTQLTNNRPLFATFHSGIADTAPTTSNTLLNSFLDKTFLAS